MTQPAQDRLNAPAWTRQVPFVEDYYVEAKLPDEAASVWVRYTLDVSAGDAAARVWAIVERDGETVAAREAVFAEDATLSADPFRFQTPHGDLTATGCGGQAGQIRWELTWDPSSYAFWQLPGWAYDLPDVVSKTVTPNPDLRVHGQVHAGGEVLELEGAPGSQGHVWGRSHADAWAWAHANAGEGPVWSVVAARADLAGWRTPLLAAVVLRRGDQTLAFRNVLANEASFDGEGLAFEAATLRYRVRGTVRPPEDALVGVTYPDPVHGEVHCHNTKLADGHLVLEERTLTGWREVDRWAAGGSTAFEVGGVEPIDGVPWVLEG